jgi:hypothetical protein
MNIPREREIIVEGTAYKLLLNLNAQCLFEEKSGQNFYRVMNDPSYQASAVEDRLLFWCMLRKNHPEVTIEQAGELMVATSSLLNIMSTAIREAQPEPREKVEGEEPTPTKPTG